MSAATESENCASGRCMLRVAMPPPLKGEKRPSGFFRLTSLTFWYGTPG